jgi:hypothetical protein
MKGFIQCQLPNSLHTNGAPVKSILTESSQEMLLQTQDPMVLSIKAYGIDTASPREIIINKTGRHRLLMHTPFHHLFAFFSNLHLPLNFLKEELDK